MKSLADDLAVTYRKIMDRLESAPITPKDGINYWLIAAVLLAITWLLLLVVTNH